MKAIGSAPLLTPRLKLRPLRRADLDELHRLWSDPLLEPWIGPHTRAETAQELDFHIAQQARCGWGMLAVEERATGRFVGDCGLQPFELRGPEVELGYDLLPAFWGRGYATEAATAVLCWALTSLALERVVAVTKPANVASVRVLEKAGLRRVGERDAYGERLLLYEVTNAPRATP